MCDHSKITFTISALVGWFMVFNATFNNISVEETGVPDEHHQSAASH